MVPVPPYLPIAAALSPLEFFDYPLPAGKGALENRPIDPYCRREDSSRGSLSRNIAGY